MMYCTWCKGNIKNAGESYCSKTCEKEFYKFKCSRGIFYKQLILIVDLDYPHNVNALIDYLDRGERALRHYYENHGIVFNKHMNDIVDSLNLNQNN